MGRKKIADEDKIDIRMRVDADLSKQIHEMADRFKQPVAAYIRSAVIRDMERIRKEDAR